MKTKTTPLKIVIVAILLTITSYSFGQNWGIGLKLGDPLGLSIKKYNGNKAFELNIGRSYYWGSSYYNNYYLHDNRFKNNAGYVYVLDSRSTPIAIQFRYLIHKDIRALDGLQWYFGAGGQFRYQSLRYRYWDGVTLDYEYERATDYGIGLDGIIGAEYKFKDLPISIAADVNLYMEIINQPFLFLPQGGVTGRYRF
jgi:hypothetical protein